ncbi:hypothetical protein J1N35_041307 [Gossypium stocksii]|uniref:Uncharacterized protein n=1 Tax=Gossypium stocksii TaxID=47602 RepID=A0A9D3UFQ7_9ROSI|nr:hypothetical protein J1N35_041307 [Gossypium stocksii]
MCTIYWLKVKGDGSLINDLDLFHHWPYECLLLGYCQGKEMDSNCHSVFRLIKDKHFVISIPGGYSRKPPIRGIILLMDYLNSSHNIWLQAFLLFHHAMGDFLDKK